MCAAVQAALRACLLLPTRLPLAGPHRTSSPPHPPFHPPHPHPPHPRPCSNVAQYCALKLLEVGGGPRRPGLPPAGSGANAPPGTDSRACVPSHAPALSLTYRMPASVGAK